MEPIEIIVGGGEATIVSENAGNCPFCNRAFNDGAVRRMLCKPCQHPICIACGREAVNKWTRKIPMVCKICNQDVRRATLDQTKKKKKKKKKREHPVDEEEQVALPEIVEVEEEDETPHPKRANTNDDDAEGASLSSLLEKREMSVATGDDQDLECCICATLFDNQTRCPYRVTKFREPVTEVERVVAEIEQATCGHTFCQSCCVRYTEAPCPVCRSHIVETAVNEDILRKVVARDAGRYVAMVTEINAMYTDRESVERLKMDAKKHKSALDRVNALEHAARAQDLKIRQLTREAAHYRLEAQQLQIERAKTRELTVHAKRLFEELIDLRVLAVERGLLDPSELGLLLVGSGPNGDHENTPNAEITVEVSTAKRRGGAGGGVLKFTRRLRGLPQADINVLRQIEDIVMTANDNGQFVPDRQQVEASVQKLPEGGEVLVRTGTWLHRTIKALQCNADNVFASANFGSGGADGVCIYERTTQELVDKGMEAHREAVVAKERATRARSASSSSFSSAPIVTERRITSMYDVCVACFKHFEELKLECHHCGSCNYNRCASCATKPLYHACVSGLAQVGPGYGIPLAGPRAKATTVNGYLQWLYDAFVCQNTLKREPASPEAVASEYLRYVMNNGVRRVRLNQERRAWIIDHLSKMCKTRTTPEEDAAKAEYRAGTIEEVAKLWMVDATNVVSIAHHLQELLHENIDHIARTIRTNTRFTVHEPKDDEEQPQTINRRVCDACSRLTIDDMIHCEHGGEVRVMPPERTEYAMLNEMPVYVGHTMHVAADADDGMLAARIWRNEVRAQRLRALYATPPEDAVREGVFPFPEENHVSPPPPPTTQQDMFRAYVGTNASRELFATAAFEMYRIPFPSSEPEPQPQGPATAHYDLRTSALRAGSQQYQTWREANDDAAYMLPDLPNLPDESESL